MDHLQRAWYGQKFEIAYLTKRGNEFQDWFKRIAELAYGSDFEPIRAYGPKGDLKCDGRRLTTGTIFQCYAPDQIRDRETIAKINEDFYGALNHWQGFIKEWCFVYNSPALPPTVGQHLDQLQKECPMVAIGRWGYAKLHDLVFQMPEEKLVDLFGYAPTLAMLQQVGYEDLKLVLEAIAQKEPDPLGEPPKAPSADKVEKNGLSSAAVQLLRIGRIKEPLVAQFLRQSSWPEAANRIAKAVRDHYLTLKELGVSGDEMFARMRQFIGTSSEPKREAAELAVMSYFFEACDIFEDPDKSRSDLEATL